MNTTASLDLRIDAISELRRRTWLARAAIYGAIAAAVAWSVYAIVVADTDWTISRTLGRFLEFDVSLLPELVDPAIDTVLMATLATLLGLFLALPVAWLGASNITPLGKASFLFGQHSQLWIQAELIKMMPHQLETECVQSADLGGLEQG